MRKFRVGLLKVFHTNLIIIQDTAIHLSLMNLYSLLPLQTENAYITSRKPHVKIFQHFPFSFVLYIHNIFQSLVIVIHISLKHLSSII